MATFVFVLRSQNHSSVHLRVLGHMLARSTAIEALATLWMQAPTPGDVLDAGTGLPSTNVSILAMNAPAG